MDQTTGLSRMVRRWRRAVGRSIVRTFLRPQMVAFIPALMLGAYWFGGQGVLVIVALTFPLLVVLGGMFDAEAPAVDGLTGLLTPQALCERLDDALLSARAGGEETILVALEIDEAEELEARLGVPAMEEVIARTADRALGAVRRDDKLARLGPRRFAILLHPVRSPNMDVALRTVERVQGAVADPISIDATTIYITLSAGFCLERRVADRSGRGMIAAAEAALSEAQLVGGGAVRAYSADMRARLERRESLAADFERGLEDGEVVPWFQPQLSTESGDVTGMEALARWRHPERGLVPPNEFLPVAEAGGLMERLGEVMLFRALAALRKWDKEGLVVPSVGVNFSHAELRNPRLVDQVKWELDRFDLTPPRLTVEVLETVVSDTDDDAIAANLAGLAALGCRIDLDDFGTGAASIANIRRFSVSRIKIDRAFVSHADSDPGQAQMAAAILSFAQKLDVGTLAEGIQTMGEFEAFARLGCGHVQGFALAKPMPLDEAQSWLRAHAARGAGAISAVG